MQHPVDKPLEADVRTLWVLMAMIGAALFLAFGVGTVVGRKMAQLPSVCALEARQ